MEEQLINFETAKLAKEKGFNENTPKKFLRGKLLYNDISNKFFGEPLKDIVPAPTQSLLQKWLRDKYNIFVWHEVSLSGIYINVSDYKYSMSRSTYGSDGGFETWEEALEKGLQEALKLIK